MNKKPPKCPNCKKEMERIFGVWALTGVEQKEDSSLLFNPASGIPVVAYGCKKCGELKLFSAVLLGEIKL